jgi:putative NADH-flavin reductase
MKILLFGGTGHIGRRVVKEALLKGYHVNAVQRTPDDLGISNSKLTITRGDMLKDMDIQSLIKDTDIVVSAISPAGTSTPEQFKKANSNLIKALEKTPTLRVIVVGGAGSTEVAPGLRAMDSPIMDQIPEEWKPDIYAHAEVLDLYKASNTNWTYFSPAMLVGPGERTGKYRLGTTNMIVDSNGESKISYEDYACALVDEIARAQYIRSQFSIGY